MPDELRFCTPFLHVAVACDDDTVAQRVAALFAGYPAGRTDGPPTLRYAVHGSGLATALWRDGQPLHRGEPCNDVLASLEGDVYRRILAAAAQQQWVALHAAAVVLGEVALLLVGASGAGKSTLTLELLRREPCASYMTDDVAFVSPNRQPPYEVAGLPRLVGFDAPWPAALAPLPAGFAVSEWTASGRKPGTALTRSCVAVPRARVRDGSARLAAIVFPHYEPGCAAAVCEPLPVRETAAQLWQALHLPEPAAAAFDCAGRLAAGVPAYRLISATREGAYAASQPLLHALRS